jgi:hypothetical protein
MFGAGLISGLLGIGSGALKVLAMDQAMADSLQGLHRNHQLHDRCNGGCKRRYLLDRGYIDPGLAIPVMACWPDRYSERAISRAQRFRLCAWCLRLLSGCLRLR